MSSAGKASGKYSEILRTHEEASHKAEEGETSGTKTFTLRCAAGDPMAEPLWQNHFGAGWPFP